jgi:type I restriction enzyme, R subunit
VGEEWRNISPFIEGNNTMPTKREVLAVLGRDDLLTGLDHAGLEVRDRRVKDELVEALAASKKARLNEMLALLSRDSLKESDELPRLQARHAAAVTFFAKVKNKDDLDACVSVLEPEDVRAAFDAAFRRFSQSLDMLLPEPRALPYVSDLRWLGKVRQAARARFRDTSLDLADCGAKVRKLIEEAISVEGIQVLVKEVSLFSKDFQEKVEKLGTPEARASEMEHAIKHEIHVHIEENPAFYESLRDRLEKIIEDRKAERIEAAKQLELLQVLVYEVRNEAKAGQDVGLSPTAFAIYGLLEDRPTVARDSAFAMPKLDEPRKALAGLIEEALAPYVAIVGFQAKADVQREMRAKVKRQLRAARIDEERIEALALRIVSLAKARRPQ